MTEPALQWTILSEHGLVLACLLTRSEATVLEIMLRTGLDWRAAQRALRQLEHAGYICHSGISLAITYRIKQEPPLQRPLALRCKLGDLLALVAYATPEPSTPAAAPARHSARAPVWAHFSELTRRLVSARSSRRR